MLTLDPGGAGARWCCAGRTPFGELQGSGPDDGVVDPLAGRPTDYKCFTAPEAVAYDMADEVIGGPAGVPESGTPA
jgi:hypothetical protein